MYDYVEEFDHEATESGRAYLVQEWVDGGPLSGVLLRHGRLTPAQSLGVLRGADRAGPRARPRPGAWRHQPRQHHARHGGYVEARRFRAGRPDRLGRGGRDAHRYARLQQSGGGHRPADDRPQRRLLAAAVLFLLLSGRLPFAGDPAAVLAAHVSAAVPRLPDCGPELADLLIRAMAKDAAARPPDAAALLAELEEAAQRSYGAGWLQRSSVAGLAGASVGVAGLAASSAGTPGVAALPVVSTAGVVTPPGLAGASAQVGAKVLGLPRLAVVLTSAVVVVAAAASAFALTRPSSADPDEAARGGPVATGEDVIGAETTAPTSTTATPTTPAPLPEPVFAGTYTVAVTVTTITGSVFDPAVGGVQNVTWTVTAACPAGPCDVSAASTSGRTFDFTYADGSWSYPDRPSTVECVDSVTGVPLGTTAPSTIDAVLTPTTPIDPDTPMAATELSGTVVETVAAPGCGSGGSVTTSTIVATRTGD